MKWPVMSLSSLVDVMHQGINTAADKVEYSQSGYPIIQSKHLKENCVDFDGVKYLSESDYQKYSPKYVPQKGDILFANIGSIGKSLIIDTGSTFLFAWNVFLIRPKHELIDVSYLKYFFDRLLSIKYYDQYLTGGTVKFVNKKVMGEIEIPLPPLEEQKRIAAILDKADGIRRKRQQAIQLADDFLRAVFLDMFGDPVTNPKGWDIGRFSDISMLNPKAEKYDNELSVSFVPMPSVSEKSHILDPSDVRDYSAVKKGFTAFKENDVLFAKITPCMENGKAAIATNLKNGIGFGSTEFHVFRPQNMDYAPFIYSLLHLPLFRKIAASNFSGAVGHKRVPKDFLSSFELFNPPEGLVIKFKTIFETVNESKSKFEKNVEGSEQLFNSLSQKAFAGEL